MPKSKSIPEPDNDFEGPKTDQGDDLNADLSNFLKQDAPEDSPSESYESSPEFKNKWKRIVSEGWPFPEDNAPEPPGAPGNETEPEPQPVRSFDWVVKITSLDLPELLDYPKGTDEFDVAYRRVPTSIGPVPAHVGNYLAKSEGGVHVLRTDPRGSGHEPASDDL